MKPIKVYERQRRHKMLVLLDLLLIMAVTFSIAVDLAGARTQAARINLFLYFTIQSNLLMLLSSAWAIIKERISPFYHYLRLGATLNMLITAISYHFLLSATHQPQNMDLVANLLLHYLVPAVAVISWFFYLRLYRTAWWAPLGWLFYPLLYVGGILLRGRMTGIYPYWFLNPVAAYPNGTGSYMGVLTYLGIVLAGYFVLGFLLVLINNLPHRKKRQ